MNKKNNAIVVGKAYVYCQDLEHKMQTMICDICKHNSGKNM